MKHRTAKDLRELSKEDLLNSLNDLNDSLARLRFQSALGQLHNTSDLRNKRKEIARIKTVLSETKFN